MPGKFGDLVGAIDEGTSSARFLIFRAESSEIIASHQKSVTNIFPKEGWYEQDPQEILDVVNECITKAIEKLIELGGEAKDLIAIGITNQRESTIVWDSETGEPLYNAIIWSDIRTIPTVEELLQKVPNNTKNKNYLKPLCGLPVSTYFSAVKLKWLLDNAPRVKAVVKADKKLFFGTVDTWLIWNLTKGVHITDVTNASRTMLMNLETLEWDPILKDFFEVPDNVILPTIKSSSEVYGYMNEGVLKDVPISCCLGDQQAALVGQRCLEMSEAKCTYGTGCFLLYCTGNVKVDSTYGLLTTVAYQLENQAPVYALEGSVAVAGSCLSWLKDNMEIIHSLEEIDTLVKSVKDNGDVYFVPAFSGLFAPHWDSEARGIICGITEETERGHFVVAALESVCFQVRDILDAMNLECGTPLTKLKVDGGMTNNSMLMQWQADLIGLEVSKPSMIETTALGAAMFAGHAVGKWDINAKTDVKARKFKPQISEDERDVRFKKWKMAIERSLGWDQN
ncbi:CLUMA_CG001238, isoform A [Clunio marinus]|uniref:Probable glycerol kinase n=1 Tax=Clunio marinus TaxID=568069 RepID=A0A1J1HHF5_9DIPT|nr:CLUMA_CG001238, isoform A [Clunio marinus]